MVSTMIVKSLFCVNFLHSIGNVAECNAFKFTLTQKTFPWIERAAFIQNVVSYTSSLTLTGQNRISSENFTLGASSGIELDTDKGRDPLMVAYRSLTVPIKDTEVPVALWYPMAKRFDNKIKNASALTSAQYKHCISIPRIGELLASIDFLPSFLQKRYNLNPSLNSISEQNVFVADGTNIPLPSYTSKIPIIFLAHGYLGSRFDLSHIAESLAQQGFLCISPEYPESLAASYPRVENLSRTDITNAIRKAPFFEKILSTYSNERVVYGIIGHSLGCGTATNTGDKSWVRVCIAGYPGEREDTIGGDMLFISSVNDGAVSLERLQGAIPTDFVRMDENDDRVQKSIEEYKKGMDQRDTTSTSSPIARRSALIFTGYKGPNHISFLAGSVNDAMIDLLSPLLPVAQALNIPVLDFDKYQVSQDSEPTAKVVIPLISSYLRQRMLN